MIVWFTVTYVFVEFAIKSFLNSWLWLSQFERTQELILSWQKCTCGILAVNILTTGKKTLPPWRLYFQMHFLEWKVFSFKLIFIDICSLKFNWQFNIGFGNALASYSWHVLTKISVTIINDHMASLGHNELARPLSLQDSKSKLL